MSSRMFDQLILPLVESHRYPVIAPDRRGFGQSSSAWATPSLTGGEKEVTFDTFVADAVALLESVLAQDPRPFVFVGASMGCSESVLARAASGVLREWCRGFVWIGPNMPYSLRCEASPASPGPEVWDALVEGFRGAGGKEFITGAVPSIFRTDLGNVVGESTLRFFEGLVCQADPMAVERTAVLCQRPMADELRALAEEEGERLPVLILHGDSDSGMPLETSAAVIKEMLPWAELKVYEKAGHGEFVSFFS